MSSHNSDLLQKVRDQQHRIADLERALLESEENFRSLADFAPVGIYLDDAQGHAIYINKKCAELVGVPAEEALSFNWIPRLHPDDRERMVSAWEEAFKNSTEFRLEYRWVHVDGKVVWTLGEVVPIIGDDGKASMFIGTLTDITAHKNAEVEKENLQLQLIQAQRMESIGRLAGGVAHDYNNMLSVILSYTELAMNEVDATGELHEKLRHILEAAERSAQITSQLLNFARKQIILPTVFDFDHSVKEMLDMLRCIIGEEIDLVFLPQAGKKTIRTDHSQLDQIVANMCINARDAIDNVGKITIETSTVTLNDHDCAEHPVFIPGEFIILSISDNGSGMNEATVDKIFEPFFTTKEKNMGTGLGLASVHGTVKQNGGFIDVFSEPGVGTTFKIYLPTYNGDITETTTLKDKTAHEAHGETILVVEDEVDILRVVQIILENSGFKVLPANTLSEALHLASHSNEEIDLLITDLVMPEITGKDLADRLKSDHPNMKCLYMSGYTADLIGEQGILEDNINFIQKPFRVHYLTSKVHEVLGRT